MIQEKQALELNRIIYLAFDVASKKKLPTEAAKEFLHQYEMSAKSFARDKAKELVETGMSATGIEALSSQSFAEEMISVSETIVSLIKRFIQNKITEDQLISQLSDTGIQDISMRILSALGIHEKLRVDNPADIMKLTPPVLAFIATLSGAAATNATLAFFGGGSIAAGGLGIAGGMVVLGGLVAGPALMVMGMITGSKSQEKLENALSNKAQANEIVESLRAAAMQCSTVRRRTYLFYNLLAHLDSYFLPQIWRMQDIIENEGTDYRLYKPDSKKAIAEAASTACTIKAVLDTPILTAEGELTEASEKLTREISERIYKN